MRFTMVWASVLKENLNLRVAVAALGFSTLLLGIVSSSLALRPPLLVERGCYTGVPKVSDSIRTESEITSFIKMAISKRFDTDATDFRTFLSDQEFHNRLAEHQELGKKQIRQRVLVNSVTISKDKIDIDCDRIIAVGQIRSVIHFPLTANIATQDRSEANPYGLLLTNAAPLKSKEGDQ